MEVRRWSGIELCWLTSLGCTCSAADVVCDVEVMVTSWVDSSTELLWGSRLRACSTAATTVATATVLSSSFGFSYFTCKQYSGSRSQNHFVCTVYVLQVLFTFGKKQHWHYIISKLHVRKKKCKPGRQTHSKIQTELQEFIQIGSIHSTSLLQVGQSLSCMNMGDL